MIDIYGNWKYEENTPESEKCDLDIVADWIISEGYKPKTSIENMAVMVILYYDCVLEDVKQGFYGIEENPYTPMINIDDVALWIKENHRLEDFDYEC